MAYILNDQKVVGVWFLVKCMLGCDSRVKTAHQHHRHIEVTPPPAVTVVIVTRDVPFLLGTSHYVD